MCWKVTLNYYIVNTTAAYREEAVHEDFISAFLEDSDVYCSFVMKSSVDKVIGFCALESHIWYKEISQS